MAFDVIHGHRGR